MSATDPSSDPDRRVAEDYLLRAAHAAAELAYAPYSGRAVGVALLAPGGDIFTSCNVENADPALAATDGQTALHIAAFNARPATVRLLLEKRPALDSLSRLGTPLHSAAAGPTMRAVFAAQVKPGKKPGTAGTLADSAICARLLAEAGAPLAAPDANGTTPLQTAAAFGNKEVLAELAARPKADLKGGLID